MSRLTAKEKALSDLHMVHAIMVLCTNTLFETSSGQEFARKVARLCSDEGSRQANAYDRTSRTKVLA